MMALSAVPAERQVGSTIGGKYRLIRVLGRGGMGVVYEAEHAMTRRRVAIKVLHAHHKETGDASKRFINEAQAAGKISSPNVVEVLDGGEDSDGSLYLVMELLSGHDLATQLLRHRRLEVAETVTTIAQVLQALIVAHRKGIIHRDIKPENIFLTRGVSGEPQVKILDFGISKAVEADGRTAALSVTQTNTTVGTPHYMSPEQARGERTLDQRADLWAVGVVMYECLAGHVPFDGETYNDQIVRVITEPHIPLSSFDVPLELSNIVDRSLAKDRTRRYANAAEMLGDVRRFIERHREYASVPAHLLREPAAAPDSVPPASSGQPTVETVLDPAFDPSVAPARDTAPNAPVAELPSLIDTAGEDAPTTVRLAPDEPGPLGPTPLAGVRRGPPSPGSGPMHGAMQGAGSGAVPGSLVGAPPLLSSPSSQFAPGPPPPQISGVRVAAPVAVPRSRDKNRRFIIIGAIAVGIAIAAGTIAAIISTNSDSNSGAATSSNAMITLAVRGMPPGAHLVVGGVPFYGSDSAVLPRSSTPTVVEISAPGFRSARFNVVPDQDRTLNIALDPDVAPLPPAPVAPTPTGIAPTPLPQAVAPQAPARSDMVFAPASDPPARATPPAPTRAANARRDHHAPSATRVATPPTNGATAGSGFVTVEAQPPCNVVMIDSTRVGPSPVRRRPIPAGAHRVLCQSSTGALRSRVANITARQESLIRFTP